MTKQLSFIPYGKQLIDDDDVDAVTSVLRSDWLTTGPQVKNFEDKVADLCAADHAVAVSSGTAALHAALFALGVGPGDEVIVPPLTFAADANAALYLGAVPIFADIDADTLQIDAAEVEKKISSKTKVILAVDYAGLPCDYDLLGKIAQKYGVFLVADACHSIGALQNGKKVGTLADLTVLSFHPVKHITTGEGGMVLARNPAHADRMRIFRNHGITTDHRQRAETGSLNYEMTELGFNYRMTDFQCALGASQLKKLGGWVKRRQEIANCYYEGMAKNPLISFQGRIENTTNAHHLFVIKVDVGAMTFPRDHAARKLREMGIGVNVHYPPIHLHPYYRQRFGYQPGDYPVTEKMHQRILSIPMYPALTESDVTRVISSINSVLSC